MIRLSIPGEPVSWARARTNGKRFFTAKKQAVAMDVIRFEAQRVMGGRSLLEGPLSVHAKFIYQWPKSWSEKRRRAYGSQFKLSRPDASNLLKLAEDALNGVVWQDDAQVVVATIEKSYGQTPASVITIEQFEVAR